MIQILIKVSRDQQLEIEDFCVKEGKTLSEYFLSLHLEKKEKHINGKDFHENSEQAEILKLSKKNEKISLKKNK